MVLSEETLAQFPAALRGMVSRSMVNLLRVDGLIQIYDQQKQGASSIPHFEPADILRACVVLLHATLEDILRSAALALMPRTAGPDQWDAISTGESRQPEKIRLGWLR